MLLHGQRTVPSALAVLGFGRPRGVAPGVSVIFGVVLVACMPLVFRAAGAELVLPDNWLVLALGIFLLNGIAEETVYRGYLFRRLREGRTFKNAVLIGIALHAAAHGPLFATTGVGFGLAGVALAALAFPPIASLYERGGDTIWAPAVLHATIDLIIVPLSASGASPTTAMTLASLGWLGLALAVAYLAALFVYWSSRRMAAAPAAVVSRSAQT